MVRESPPTEITREVARLARSILGEDAEVIWFGSWPRGQARPHSDIDLTVSIGNPIAPQNIALLHEAVDDLPTHYDIDILDLSATGPAFREEILNYGERL